MKGLVKTNKGVGCVGLKDVPNPVPQEGEVLVQVKFAGICGTDIHILHDEFPYYPPVILGHEFSGEIVELGKGVQNWKIGDRVVAEPHNGFCGVCDLCRAGYSQICSQKRSLGWGRNGAFAQYMSVPALLLHKIPENVSFESAAITEPLAVVIHEVVERGQILAGDRVVVFGVGPIGLLAALVARTFGAIQVIMVGTDLDQGFRFQVAEKIPVDAIVNVSRENTVEKIEKLTKGKMADLVIEASGAAKAIAQTVEVVKERGRITAIGLPGDNLISFPWKQAMLKVVDLYFNMSSSHSSWVRSIAIMEAELIDPGFVISHRFSLKDWEKAFNVVKKQEGGKALLSPII